MALEDILALLAKLPADQKELKDELTASVKGMNQDKGKALQDLMNFKTENETLKGDKKSLESTATTYKELAKAMSEQGYKAEDIADMAKKLKIQKDQEDLVAEKDRILKEQADELKAFRAEKEINTIKDALMPEVEKAVENLKDDKGEKIMIAPKFIPYDEIFQPIDTENPVLVEDRINKALQKGVAEQTNFMKETGLTFSGKPVHDVKVGDRHYGGNKELDLNDALKSMEKAGGSIDSMAEFFAAKRAAQKEN